MLRQGFCDEQVCRCAKTKVCVAQGIYQRTAWLDAGWPCFIQAEVWRFAVNNRCVILVVCTVQILSAVTIVRNAAAK